MTEVDEFAWLDIADDAVIEPTLHVPNVGKVPGEIMQAGAKLGKDRVWFSDGEYIWFRRKKANPATLERHNRFTASGDYKHIGTSDDVEVYKLNDSSAFKIKTPRAPRVFDLEAADWYNVRRQAALAACRRDFKTFRDIVAFMRERLNRNVGDNTESRWTQGFCDLQWADTYTALMNSVKMRGGPSPQEINMELQKLRVSEGTSVGRVITLGA
jgi:hypothetical protein